MRFLVPTAGRDLAPAIRVAHATASLDFTRYPFRIQRRNPALAKALPSHRFSSGGRGGPMHTSKPYIRTTCPESLASCEREVHLYLSLNLDRLSVEQVGLVFPLLHSFDRGGSQHRVPADQLQVLDSAFLADRGLQNNRTLDARLPSQGRISWRHLADQHAGAHARRHANPLRGSNLRSDSRRRIKNASHDSAHGATRDAARNATHHTSRCHGRRRSLVLFNHLYFLWNFGRGAQLAVDDIGLDLLYNLDRSRCWRRWRRWRWRCHQHEHCCALRQSFRENQRNQDHDADNHDLQYERNYGSPSSARL